MYQARLKTHKRAYKSGGIRLQFEIAKTQTGKKQPDFALACLGTFRQSDIFDDKKLRVFWLQTILKMNQLVRSGKISEDESKAIKVALVRHIPQPVMVAAARKFDRVIDEKVMNDVKSKFNLF